MNRLLVLAASVLLAVLVVGLCVAQDAPKPEPKNYYNFSASFYLDDDKLEAPSLIALEGAVASCGIDRKYTQWYPASQDPNRVRALAREKAHPNPKLKPARLSYSCSYMVRLDYQMTPTEAHRLFCALLPIVNDESRARGRVIMMAGLESPIAKR